MAEDPPATGGRPGQMQVKRKGPVASRLMAAFIPLSALALTIGGVAGYLVPRF